MKELLQGTITIIVGTLLLKALGWVRELLLAYRFGVSRELDVLLVALTVPTFVSGIIGSALATAIVPTYHRWRASDPDTVGSKLARLAGVLLAVLVVTTGLIVLLAPFLARAIAPGFGTPELGYTQRLMLPLALAGIPMALTAYWRAIVQAEGKFELQVLGGAVGSVVTVVGIWWLTSSRGAMGAAEGIAMGATAGLGFFAFYHWWSRRRFPVSFVRDSVLWQEVAGVWRLMAPIVGGLMLSQSRVIVDRLIASGLQPGAIAALNYAERVVNLPTVLLADGVMTVFFPTLARHLANGQISEARQLLTAVRRLLVIAFVPVTVIVVVLAEPLVRFLFERGAFDVSDTVRTAAVVQMYALGLLPSVLGTVYMRAFHASGETLRPVLYGLLSTGVNIAASVVLARWIGAPGVALATSLSMVIRAALMGRGFATWASSLPGAVVPGEKPAFWRHLASSLMVLLVCVLAWFLLPPFEWPAWLVLLVGGVLMMFPYAGLWWRWRALVLGTEAPPPTWEPAMPLPGHEEPEGLYLYEWDRLVASTIARRLYERSRRGDRTTRLR